MRKKYLVIGTLKNGEKLYGKYTLTICTPRFTFSYDKPIEGFSSYASNPKDAVDQVCSIMDPTYLGDFKSIEAIEITNEEIEIISKEPKEDNKHDEHKDHISRYIDESPMSRIVVTTDSGKTLYLNKEKIDRILVPENAPCLSETTFKYEFLEDKWWSVEKNALYSQKTWEVDIVPDLFDFDLFIGMIIKRYNDFHSDKIKEYKIQER